MLPRSLVLAAAALALVLGACKDQAGTQILLGVHFPALELDTLRITASSERRAFPTARRPDPAAGILVDPQSIVLLLPDEVDREKLALTVEGLRLEQVRATGTTSVIAERGESVSATVWLSRPPPDGGGDLRRDLGLEDLPRSERRDLPRDARRDGTACSPGAFVACQATTLQRCNASGSGIVTEDCAPFACNASAKRCNECDPAAAPVCIGSDLVTCSTLGLKLGAPCPLGCAKGLCCTDQDGDKVTTCAGDCDDIDPDAHPGQLGFFSSPSKGTGSYDFNCDATVELELTLLEGCARLGAACVGNGWQTSVPACGVAGTFVTCKPSGRTMCSHDTAQTTQRCR